MSTYNYHFRCITKWIIAGILFLLCGLLFAAEPVTPLTHRWKVETSRPTNVTVEVYQGETLTLEATLTTYSRAFVPPQDAEARFFWRDSEARGAYWSEPATLTGNKLTFTWTPNFDVGAKRYDFFLSVDSDTEGTAYRALGTLVMRESPGFNPAQLDAPDVLADIVDRTADQVLAQTDAKYAALGHNHDGVYLKSYTETDPLWSAAQPGIEATLQSANQQISQSAADIVSLQEDLSSVAERSATNTADIASLETTVWAGLTLKPAAEILSGVVPDYSVSPNVATNQACNPATVVLVVDVAETYTPSNNGHTLVRFGQWNRGSTYFRVGSENGAAYLVNSFADATHYDFSPGRHVLAITYEKLSASQTKSRVTFDGVSAGEQTLNGMNGLSLWVPDNGGAGYDGLTFKTFVWHEALAQADVLALTELFLHGADETTADALSSLRTHLAEHTHDQYLTSFTESDPTVPSWAKAANKPTYSWNELTNKPTLATLGGITKAQMTAYFNEQGVETDLAPITRSNALHDASKAEDAILVRKDENDPYSGFGTRSISVKNAEANGVWNFKGRTVENVSNAGLASYTATTYPNSGGSQALLGAYASTGAQTVAAVEAKATASAASLTLADATGTLTLTPTSQWPWSKLSGVPSTFTPATHNHDSAYLKLSGGTVSGNITLNGSKNYVTRLIFGGAAADAGLKTRGIAGLHYNDYSSGTRGNLYLNYDANHPSPSTEEWFNLAETEVAGRGTVVLGGTAEDVALRKKDGDYLYAAKTHTNTEIATLQSGLATVTSTANTNMGDIFTLQSEAATHAPLSAVTMTESNVTYIWQWDEDAGTFALVPRE